jgi:hypothetical protein
LLLIFASFCLQAKEIELKIDSSWGNKTTKKETSKIVRATLGQTWKMPIESTSNMFLKMTVSQYSSQAEFKDDPEEILFKTELIEMVNGKETILAKPEVITVLGRKATITNEATALELTFLPTRIEEEI